MNPLTPEQWAAEAALALATAAGRALAHIVRQWLENLKRGVPDMPVEELTTALVQHMVEVNGMAWSIGDKAITDLASQHAGIEIPELGLTPPEGDEQMLAKSIDTIFSADHELLVQRMERLGLAAPMRASKRSLQESMRQRGITEYIRIVQPNACDACASRLGEIRSIDVIFGDHPNCACRMRAVVSETWGDVVKERALQLRLVTPSGTRFSSGIQFENIEKGASK